MAPSPTQFRLSVSIAVFAVVLGAIYWVGRYPVLPRRAGAQPNAVTFPSWRTPGRASVDGVVLGVDGKPSRADVSLVIEAAPAPIRGGPARGRRAAVNRTTDDGRFAFSLVPSGHYVVIARMATGDEASDASSLWAAAEVDAADNASVTTRLKLQRSGELSGRIALEALGGAARADLTEATVGLDPVDVNAKASLLDGFPRVHASGDGRFFLLDVPPGQYRLAATVSSPWMIDRITVNGQDGLDRPIAIEPGSSVSSATIMATDVPNRIDGQALDSTGRPLSFALIFAFASDLAERGLDRRTQAVRADRTGRFSVTGLPSGDYLVGIANGGEPQTWYTPPFLTDLARGATFVRLRTGITRATVVGGPPK
jgi:hypothetical protein